ncbi:WD40/YVTN/BNR-like repeat-containing protein, partial [Acidobacteriota bacterium]
AATGGLWKTDNSGITWEPIFDDMPSGSIGDLALDPTNPDVVWLGTGEANIFRASTAGTGIYKSTDAGKTWTHMGLADTHTISRILIHPKNTDTLYVTSTGHEWTKNEDRGVFKTVDGGKTWKKILYLNDYTGTADIVLDPTNPDVLLASMWNRTRERWSDPRPGPGDGIYKTTDGGKTWNPSNQGLPDLKLTGRIGLSLCDSKPNVVYAFVDNHNPGRMPEKGERDAYGRIKTGQVIKGAEIYRSDNQGQTWTKVSPDDRYMEGFGGTYGWVFGQIRVDPSNENTVYIMGLRLAKSIDGGKSWETLRYPELHGDHHGLWIDPEDSDYLINVNDGGINISYDGGSTWRDFHRIHPLVQFYNVAYDMELPFNVYGSVQDHGTYRGNVSHRPGSSSRRRAPTQWEPSPGGEGTKIAVDPTNPNIVYSSSFYGRLMRSERIDGQWKSTNIYPTAVEGEPAYRGQWLSATILSPHNPRVVYHGFQYLFRSMNQGETWERISPDLSYNNPKKMGKLPFAIPHQCITAISESPFKFGYIYAGTDDGRVHVTRDGGANWTEITRGLPYNKHVSRIVASQYEKDTVYLTLNGRRDDDFADYVYKSVDGGKTWMDISGNIPGGPVNVIREDPKKQSVLYVGTDLGVYATVNGGQTWDVIAEGLPNTFVWDLIIHPRDNSMVIATNGRGMWVIESVSTIQEMAK